MFVFKLWSRFGAFRDPITITQNVSLSIPPKTTIGGMLASILGMDYNAYFDNPNYFDFGYSLVLKNPIRKQSFSQNYVIDYTKESSGKHDTIKKSLKKSKVVEEYKNQVIAEMQTDIFGKIDESVFENDEVYARKMDVFQKELVKLNSRLINKMPKPKPIRRELLLDPSYLIFIKDFEFEDEIIERLKSHNTGFALFMGNSEFSANYAFLECVSAEEKPLTRIDSFTQYSENIEFELNRKYTTVYSATKTVSGRKYRDFKKITLCDDAISFNDPVDGVFVKTSEGDFNCEFI